MSGLTVGKLPEGSLMLILKNFLYTDKNIDKKQFSL